MRTPHQGCRRERTLSRRIYRGDVKDLVSRNISTRGVSQLQGKGLVYLGLAVLPGVNPKPRFGPILDSTVSELPLGPILDSTVNGLPPGALKQARGIHRRFIYKWDLSTHAEGTDPRGGLSERVRASRPYRPPFTETKKHSPSTGARANNSLQVTRPST